MIKIKQEEDGGDNKRKHPEQVQVKAEEEEEAPPVKRERLAEHALTSGAVKKLVENKGMDPPRLQILEIERRDNHKRHKLKLSDGESIAYGMTNSTLHPLFESGTIAPGVVFSLQQWVRNTVGGNTVISVLDISDVTPPCDTIGQPEMIDAPAIDPAASLVGSAKKAPSGVAQRPPDEVTAGRGPGAPPVRNTVHDLHESRPMGRLVGRVVEKRGPYAFKGKRQGSLMKCIFEDDTGRIGATTFSKDMITKMQNVELNTVVSFTDPKGSVQKANPQYQIEGCVTNELKISGEGRFSPVGDDDDAGTLDTLRSLFQSKDVITPLRNLSTLEIKAKVPMVLGLVVRSQPNITDVAKRDGSGSFAKRQIDIVDETGATRVALFEKLAKLPVWEDKTRPSMMAIELCNATVDEYNGTYSLTAWDGSASLRVLDLEEDERALKLATWIVRGVDVANTEDGVSTATGSAAFLADVAEAMSEKGMVYPSCPRDPTHQKRLEQVEIKTENNEKVYASKMYRCPKCPDAGDEKQKWIDLETDPVIWRWSLSATFRDETGETVVTAFDEFGRVLMGMSATQFRTMAPDAQKLHVASRKFRKFDTLILVEPTPTQNGTGAVRMRRTLLSATIVGDD